MIKWLCLLLLCSSCSINPGAQQSKIKNYSTSISQNGSVSIYAVDLKNGKNILDMNGHQRMTPASLTKVFTTGAVLNQLGKNYTFTTSVYLTNKNDLVIVGGGDPTLGSKRFKNTDSEFFFKKIIQSLTELGHSNLNDILVDESYYSDVNSPSKRIWEDMANYYGALPNGLSYRENAFKVMMQSPSEVGQKCRITNVQPLINRKLNCLVNSAENNKDSAYIYGHRSMKEWYVTGTIPKGRSRFTIKGAMPEPELVLGRELKAYLIQNGISIKGGVDKSSGGNRDDWRKLYENKSPKLIEIVKVVNKKSHNLFADHLLFELGKKSANTVNWDGATKTLRQFWTGDVEGFSGEFYDGSGLSPFNVFSALDIVKALEWMYQSKCKDEFISTLSIGGVDGTLKGIFDDKLKGKFFGKSGSMNGVLGYCGYLVSSEGNDIAFCVIANRFTEDFSLLRANIELLMKELVEKN